MTLRELAKAWLAKAEAERTKIVGKAYVVRTGHPYTCPAPDNASVTINKSLKELAIDAQAQASGQKVESGQPDLEYSDGREPDCRTPRTLRTVRTAGQFGQPDVVDNAAEDHQRRIAAKEADLGPDGSTKYQRLVAEGAKTAKAALAAGKTANTPPAATDGAWPEPKITGNPPFGIDHVPNRYELEWKALLAGCPPWAAEWQWAETIFSCRDLFGEWGSELLRLDWRPDDVFDRWHGLGWFLKGKKVMALGARHAFLECGRIFERTGR
jgi:hypothetical protein